MFGRPLRPVTAVEILGHLLWWCMEAAFLTPCLFNATHLAVGTGQPIFFLAPSIEGHTIVILFSVVRHAYGELTPHIGPPSIKHKAPAIGFPSGIHASYHVGRKPVGLMGRTTDGRAIYYTGNFAIPKRRKLTCA